MISSLNMQMTRFLLRFLMIALVILLFDRGIGAILNYCYFNTKSGECYRTTYAIDSTVAEIIIFGSSRAKCSYVPKIFEDSLHYSCYNTGRDGNFILFNYAMFKEITNRYNPKFVIFDISPEELEYRTWEYDRLSLLLPYYQTHSEIRRIVDLKGSFEKIKFLSAIYPFNSLVFKIALGNLELNQAREPDYNGYAPYFETLKNEKLDTTRISNFLIDEQKIKALNDIVFTCKEKGIKLIFVHSPIWSIIQDGFGDPVFSEFCNKMNVSYLNISNHPIFINNPNYFADKLHLNYEGAQIFSNMLIDEIGFKNK